MKSSNPQVMVQAYRLLVKTMEDEFGECYPLHLGVTEAGDGEDGRIKSAIGIGTLLEDGIGDTIRVSLTEDPELEIPVCRDIVKRYSARNEKPTGIPAINKLPYSPFEYKRRPTFSVNNIGDHHVPVVVADMSKISTLTHSDLQRIGYTYDSSTDKWTIADIAADYIFTGNHIPSFALPGTLNVILNHQAWLEAADKTKCFPIFESSEFINAAVKSNEMNFVMVDCFSDANGTSFPDELANARSVVICVSSVNPLPLHAVRRMIIELEEKSIRNPVVVIVDSNEKTSDEHLIHYATETGALLLDGMGDGICLGMTRESYDQQDSSLNNARGRTYMQSASVEQFINNTAFSILQATRTRISKTEYISCPSCGRTLFDLQETTAKIRSVTHHLKGVKIAIMGCIVNGPGEMADADFGYVGSGPGKITLYKGKEIVKRNVPSEVAVDELISLLKANEVWIDRMETIPVS
jgi:(E)-4-hydroxy-3-methylbut-2-enyl-diphosphate synthase